MSSLSRATSRPVGHAVSPASRAPSSSLYSDPAIFALLPSPTQLPVSSAHPHRLGTRPPAPRLINQTLVPAAGLPPGSPSGGSGRFSLGTWQHLSPFVAAWGLRSLRPIKQGFLACSMFVVFANAFEGLSLVETCRHAPLSIWCIWLEHWLSMAFRHVSSEPPSASPLTRPLALWLPQISVRACPSDAVPYKTIHRPGLCS